MATNLAEILRANIEAVDEIEHPPHSQEADGYAFRQRTVDEIMRRLGHNPEDSLTSTAIEGFIWDAAPDHEYVLDAQTWTLRDRFDYDAIAKSSCRHARQPMRALIRLDSAVTELQDAIAAADPHGQTEIGIALRAVLDVRDRLDNDSPPPRNLGTDPTG
jgi:hypothetical protein